MLGLSVTGVVALATTWAVTSLGLVVDDTKGGSETGLSVPVGEDETTGEAVELTEGSDGLATGGVVAG